MAEPTHPTPTLAVIRTRLIGAKYELEQSCTEARDEHLGAHLTMKLDRALLEVSGAMRQLEDTGKDAMVREREP